MRGNVSADEQGLARAEVPCMLETSVRLVLVPNVCSTPSIVFSMSGLVHYLAWVRVI